MTREYTLLLFILRLINGMGCHELDANLKNIKPKGTRPADKHISPLSVALLQIYVQTFAAFVWKVVKQF